MDLNYTNIAIFLIILTTILGAYYKFILTAGVDEDKKIKMIKRVLIVIILAGLLHVYSITEDVKLKEFFVIILALLVNVYTVIHSTKQCNYPRMYVIQLCLYSAVITIAIAGSVWYTTNNSLFGFMLNEETKETIKKAKSTFTTTLLTGIKDSARLDCPDPTHDDYNTQMQDLNENDKEKYNACLSQEVRDDLEQGI